jgi:hypothetical protein
MALRDPFQLEMLNRLNRPAGAPKYRNVKSEYCGVIYSSKAEAKYAAHLDQLKKAGVVKWWIRQVPFTLGCPENLFRVDFLVCWGLGRNDVGLMGAVEIKGMETAKFKHDKKLWASYGPIPLEIIYGKGKSEVIHPCQTSRESAPPEAAKPY